MIYSLALLRIATLERDTYNQHSMMELEYNAREYDSKQKPYIDKQLPSLIHSLNTELAHLSYPTWEKESFGRVVKKLTGIRLAYHDLREIGLKDLFKAQFLQRMSLFVERIFSSIHQNDHVAVLASATRAQQEENELNTLFSNYKSDKGTDIKLDDAAHAIGLLLWVRKESRV